MSRTARRFDNLKTTASGHCRMIRCPACGVEFEHVEPAHHLLRKHTPDDFGLPPLRESEVSADE